MSIEFLLRVFEEHQNDIAIYWRGKRFDYRWLYTRIEKWRSELDELKVTAGAVVSIESDFTPNTIALLLALIERGCIGVPLMWDAPEENKARIYRIAQIECAFHFDVEADSYRFQRLEVANDHDLVATVRGREHPGLILFTSGSSGDPKGAIHDFTGLLEKFKRRRPTRNMLLFLKFDHWGGLNTLLHNLSNGGILYTVQDYGPDSVCKLIQDYDIEVLPASPTFLNLLLISQAYKKFDLGSLNLITYGAEPMPELTLKRLNELFPSVKFQQTYGLIELGVFRSKSKSSDSLWVKLDMDYRIVAGILQIKTESAMLGYLNAESPFTEDGWFNTGDAVEVDGEFLRILGRKSEMINVGGEKVMPQEVENTILEMDNIRDVLVYKEKSPLTGHIVCAKVNPAAAEDPKALARKVKKYCRARLQSFKVPVKVEVVDEAFMSARGKKKRVI
ncbi:AMP-binding protein [Sulfidibacter corallicola]|uniref:AMP-binding protein n=1 Tax=Sulfidibacter corallicola TaxID=2818388 RepID=A0A8A4U0C0_SULCO|nr:fatty acid--CoA ligase family protein [Sulfidibacter corallicola]QTD52195.1 AMP-binding protein [Sulfidibacter corallicola]